MVTIMPRGSGEHRPWRRSGDDAGSDDPFLKPSPELRYLDPRTVQFQRSSGGILRLSLPDRSFLRVTVVQARPLSRPDGNLSVRCGEDEVGILRDLRDLPPEQRELVAAELDRRYFRPVIQRVKRIADSSGTLTWEVVTDRGPTSFSTQHPRHAAQPLGDGRWMVTDVDRNRYEIPPLPCLDRQSRTILDTYLG
jgi:hypothetical protein